ncbi:MAG: hypothetical protein HQ522_14345 [Bacteroidetes bacterium]|nr:hypothetical protein [Bacteroidota bacterium]
MNQKKRIVFIAVIALFAFAACEKTVDEPIDNSIEGTYVGTLSQSVLKSAVGISNGDHDANTDVKITRDSLLEVHCYGGDIDTTFMLNYIENHDSIMVCFTGADFEHAYGHMMGQGHMSDGMMGDQQSGQTEWEHHMDDEHKDGDEHFGGFDMVNHSFGFSFQTNETGTAYQMQFNGIKNH